jgi:hypothetical protein
MYGLEGDIRHEGNVNSYCYDPHYPTGRFGFVNAVDTDMRRSARRHHVGKTQDLPHERLKDSFGPDRRFPFGLPRTDTATATRASAKTTLAKPDRRSVGETELHHFRIQLFHSASMGPQRK